MAGKKKQKTVKFVKDKNTFAGGSDGKEEDSKKEQKKQSGVHQPRDADGTFGHDVQKSQEAETFGHNVQKPEKQKTHGDHVKKRKGQLKAKEESTFSDRIVFKAGADKTAGKDKENQKNREKAQTEKARQRKRRQVKRYQKENALVKNGTKLTVAETDGRKESDFSEEKNIFTEDSGGKQTEETKDFTDDYRHKDIRQQSERKNRQKSQIEKMAKKKHRQTKKYSKENVFIKNDTKFHDAEVSSRKENVFVKNDVKPDSAETDGRKESDFSEEKNTFIKNSGVKQIKERKEGDFSEEKNIFTEDSGGKQTEGTKDFTDIDRHQDICQQPEQKDRQKRHIEKTAQKKYRQAENYQRENTFAKNSVKFDNAETDGRKESDFSEERNTFIEDSGGEQMKGAKDFTDACQHKDTYHQCEKKGRYHRRKHRHRKHTKISDFKREFQTKDTTFTEDAEPEFKGSKKLTRLKKKAETAGKKTEAVRKKIPKKTEYSWERVFDEKTGKTAYVLTAAKKEKSFQPDSSVKMAAGRISAKPFQFAHSKIAEVEKENSAVEGAHKTEQKAEDVYHFVKRHRKTKLQRRQEKVAKLEKKQLKKEVDFRYQKFLEEHPEMQEKGIKKQIQKRIQKQRIKREYAKAKRAGQAAKETKEASVKAANFTTAAAKRIQEIAGKHAAVLVTTGMAAVLLIMIMTSISSCGAMFLEVMNTTLAGSYLSVPAEIDAADLIFSKLEMELQAEINAIETNYPDYDEYRYNLDAIGHDPFALISYLSAVHTEFTAAEVQGEVEGLFDEIYELTIAPITETRTRTETRIGTTTVTNADGTIGIETYTYEVDVEYEVTVLEVTLTAADFNTVAAGHMTEEQKEIYALYNETHGLVQQFHTPLDLYWYNDVSSYYGYRIDPDTGEEQFHRGMDIAVPAGTIVYAAIDGTVTDAAYDSHYGSYIVIEDSRGYCTKYAHMDTVSVSAGQTVTHGTVIGITGNTEDRLHIECLYNGEYYNPLFYFEAG